MLFRLPPGSARNWPGHACRVRSDLAGIGLSPEGQGHCGQHRHRPRPTATLVGVAVRNIVRQIPRKGHRTAPVRFRPAHECHPLRGKTPKVDRMAATGAAHRDRDMLRARPWRFGIPLAENAEPPAVVALAIGPGRTIVRADRQIDALSRRQQFFGDLHPRRARADNQNRTLGQLIRTTIGRRMNLQKARVLGNETRNEGTLEGAVAATTLSASIVPCEVSTRNPCRLRASERSLPPHHSE